MLATTFLVFVGAIAVPASAFAQSTPTPAQAQAEAPIPLPTTFEAALEHEPADFRELLAERPTEEVAALLAAWCGLIAERQAVFDEVRELQEPFVVVGDPPPLSTWPRRDAIQVDSLGVGESIQGSPGCPGVSQGRARVILDSHDPTDLEPGDVLVAPLTDPSWTPLFVPAAGVVVDVGAPLSHAIIVSRELGIPCVVSATDATKRIPDGALVEVNGETGVVTVLEA